MCVRPQPAVALAVDVVVHAEPGRDQEEVGERVMHRDLPMSGSCVS